MLAVATIEDSNKITFQGSSSPKQELLSHGHIAAVAAEEEATSQEFNILRSMAANDSNFNLTAKPTEKRKNE